MATNRKKRKTGYVAPESTIPENKDYIIQNCLEPKEFYDDWVDHRDGFRDWIKDGKKIKKRPRVLLEDCGCEICKERIRRNDKQRKLLRRRKAMKYRGNNIYYGGDDEKRQ